MISINSDISHKINGVKVLDNRTLNSLNINANIFTFKDLLAFCSVKNYEEKLSGIKGMGNNGIKLIKSLIKKLKKKGLSLDNIDLLENKINIENNTYYSKIDLYSNYLSLRTVNALNLSGIIIVKDLFENKTVYIKGIKGMGKKGIEEINNFKSYIEDNFNQVDSKLNDNLIIKDIIEDARLVNILSFNQIYSIGDLGKYIKDINSYSELRYLNNNDYIKLKSIYEKYGGKKKEKKISEKFIDILKNISSEDYFILEKRILGKHTLEEVGKMLGFTRERVRQRQKTISEIISSSSNLFLSQNTDILKKIINIVESHKFIFLPNDILFFNFLGFKENEINLLYLFLSGISGINGGILSNEKYCIYKTDINLTIKEIEKISNYVFEKLKKNNEDIELDDLYYELLVDKIIKKKEGTKENIVILIKKNVEYNKDYLIKENIIHRFNKNYSITDYLEKLLEKFPDGLHYSEIHKKLKELYNINKPEKYIHSVLTQGRGGINDFINIGLGLYTLKSNSKYSGEKTGDIIYLYLKEESKPKKIEDIIEYVLNRKKVNATTVRAVFDYINETRFVFYKDSTIGLKEWGLGNIKDRRKLNKYDMSLREAFYNLKNLDLLNDVFTQADFKKLLQEHFGNKVSDNHGGIYNLFYDLTEKKELRFYKKGKNNFYSLTK